MSAIPIPPVDSYAPGIVTRAPEGSVSGTSTLLLAAGVIATGASFLGLSEHKDHFVLAYLVAYMFTLSLALGALFFVLVQHVSRAGWSIVVRRIAENMTSTMVAMAILFIPIVIFSHDIWHHWMSAEIVAGKPGYDKIIAGKSGYLNETFFFVRAALYFAVWIGTAYYFRSKSVQQDETGSPELSLKMSRLGAPALVLYGFSVTFAAIDWMMSLDPHWFSTMFGVTYFAGSVMAFLGMLALLCMWMGKKGLLTDVINTEHYHDIGKLMFAFMVFWAYTNFSQYFLIQYADLPEETGWFQQRLQGNWGTIGTALCVGHFLVPFVFLLSRHMKRNRAPLAIGAALLLAMHWVDMQFIIFPNHSDNFHPEWVDYALLVGLPCIFLGLTLRGISKTNLIPVRDPKLRESLKFTNI